MILLVTAAFCCALLIYAVIGVTEAHIGVKRLLAEIQAARASARASAMRDLDAPLQQTAAGSFSQSLLSLSTNRSLARDDSPEHDLAESSSSGSVRPARL